MSEQPREPQGQRPPINIVRWSMRTVVITTCVLLLFGAVCLRSRYTSNRRLMAVETPNISSDVNHDYGICVSIGWTNGGPLWLEPWLGTQRWQALFSRPKGVLIHVGHANDADETVRRLLRDTSDLKEVKVYFCDLPEGCLKWLATQHQIEILHIRLPAIGTADAEWLSRMKRLRQMQLYVAHHNREPQSHDWSWLKALPELESLEVFLGEATDRDVIALAECPVSKILSLSGSGLTDAAVDRLCELPALEGLVLENATGVRLHLPAGRKFSASLVSLNLNGTGIDNASLAALAGLPNLNYVFITGGDLTDEGVAVLARLPALKALQLRELTRVTDAGMELLTAAKSLEEIFISGLGTTPRSIVHLMAVPNWKMLMVGDDQFVKNDGESFTPPTFDKIDEFLSDHRRKQDAIRSGATPSEQPLVE